MQNNDNQTNQNDPHNRGQNGFESISPGLCSIWLGWRDSNPRMPGPEPGALPLGDIPLFALVPQDSSIFHDEPQLSTVLLSSIIICALVF